MKKLILIMLFIASFSINLNIVKGTITGKCTCYNQSTFVKQEVDCKSWQESNGHDDKWMLDFDENFGENACDRICEEISNYYWIAKSSGVKGDYIFKSVFDMDNKWKDEWTKGCYQAEDNPNSNKCETTFNEKNCKNQQNTEWDSDSKCCNYKEVCWYYGYSSLTSEGGTLVWSKTSPCTEENKKKHPEQNCHVENYYSQAQCKAKEGKKVSIGEIEEEKSSTTEIPWYEIKPNTLTCEELIGENMYKIVHFIITTLRIIGAIIAIVNGMISLIPALVAKDGDSLKAAQKKCINMAIVLVLIILLPTLLTFIGKMFNYDLSCIV